MKKNVNKIVKSGLCFIKTAKSGVIVLKGIKCCIITYQANDIICFTISVVGTAADLTSYIAKNFSNRKKVTRVAN